MTEQELENSYKHHTPKDDQADRYEGLRSGGRVLAERVMRTCPNSRERALALTKIEEAIMWANKSIAVNEA